MSATENHDSVSTTEVKGFRKYRTGQLTQERLDRSQNGGLGVGLAGFNEQARIVGVVLDELVRYNEWLDQGRPEYVPPLSEAEKERWRWVRGQGYDVPDEIYKQL
jgi:hypothetical protein